MLLQKYLALIILICAVILAVIKFTVGISLSNVFVIIVISLACLAGVIILFSFVKKLSDF